MVGLERQRLVVAGQRLLEALRLLQGIAQVAMRQRLARFQLQRLAQQIDAALGLAALQRQHAGKMQGLEIAGLEAQDFRIGAFGFGECCPWVCSANASLSIR